MNGTVKELRDFLARQADEFECDMNEAVDKDCQSDYLYAFGAREAYLFVTRWLNEYRAEEGFVVDMKLRGREAFTFLAEKYDWNVYCGDYSTLSLTAYQRWRDSDGHIVTNTSNFVTFNIAMSSSNDHIIAYLLGDSAWYSEVWIDHDDWVTTDFVAQLAVDSAEFREWFIENIVDYEMQEG